MNLATTLTLFLTAAGRATAAKDDDAPKLRQGQRKLDHCEYAPDDFDSPVPFDAPGDGETVTLSGSLVSDETGAYTMEAKAGCQYTFSITPPSGSSCDDPYVKVVDLDGAELSDCGVSSWTPGVCTAGPVNVAVDTYLGCSLTSYTLNITGTGTSCETPCADSPPCGKKGNKVQVCHVPNGDASKAVTLCVGDVGDHFDDHSSDYCGECMY